jgi:hypothetical protein
MYGANFTFTIPSAAVSIKRETADTRSELPQVKTVDTEITKRKVARNLVRVGIEAQALNCSRPQTLKFGFPLCNYIIPLPLSLYFKMQVLQTFHYEYRLETDELHFVSPNATRVLFYKQRGIRLDKNS